MAPGPGRVVGVCPSSSILRGGANVSRMMRIMLLVAYPSRVLILRVRKSARAVTTLAAICSLLSASAALFVSETLLLHPGIRPLLRRC